MVDRGLPARGGADARLARTKHLDAGAGYARQGAASGGRAVKENLFAERPLKDVEHEQGKRQQRLLCKRLPEEEPLNVHKNYGTVAKERARRSAACGGRRANCVNIGVTRGSVGAPAHTTAMTEHRPARGDALSCRRP